MSLEQQLAGIREGMAKRVPADTAAVMAEAARELRESGIMDGVIKAGDPLPAFELQNSSGEMVSSRGLLGKGAVVLTVFRGHW